MVRAEITIANINGIHLDAANKVVNVAESFKSTVYLKTEYMDINAKSIINLVSGTLRYGDTVLCVCKGPDEKEALAAMKEILSNDLED